MKYLENDRLNKLTLDLTDVPLGRSRVIHGRVEAYSMKRVSSDKKYAYALGEKYVAEIETMENQLTSLLNQQNRIRFNHRIVEEEMRIRKQQQHKHEPVIAEGEVLAQQENDKNEGNFLADGKTGIKTETGERITPRKRSQSVGAQFEAVPEKPPKHQRTRARSFDASVLLPSQTKSALGDFCELGTRKLMIDLILTLNASFPDYDFGSIRPSDFVKISTPNVMSHVNEQLSEMVTRSKEKTTNFLADMWNSIDSVIELTACDAVYSYVPQLSRNNTNSFNNYGDADDDPMGFLLQTLLTPSEEEEKNDMILQADDAYRYNTKTTMGPRIVSDSTTSSAGSVHTASSTNNVSNSSNDNTLLWSFNYFFVNKQQKRILFFTCIETMRNAHQEMIRPDIIDNEEQNLCYVKFHNQYNDDGEIIGEIDDDDNNMIDDFDLDPGASDVAGGIPISIGSM